MILHLPIKS